MMLDHLGLSDEASRVIRAIEETTRAGQVTPDIGGTLTTKQVGDAIIESIT